MAEIRVEAKRDGTSRKDGDSGWTMTLSGGRYTITGGAFPDAYGPVSMSEHALTTFITDLHSLAGVGRRNP